MNQLFSAPKAPPSPLPPRAENPDIAAREAIRNARQGRSRNTFFVIPQSGLVPPQQGSGLGQQQQQ